MNPELIFQKSIRGEARRKKGFLSRPVRVICLSFALVIFVGTVLLCLPISSKSRTFTPVINCLFTATSATCVTGLITYDTFLHWSRFGQIVIISLIQIGGLGLVTFASFFSVLVGKKLGLREMQLAQESINFSSMADVGRMLKGIIGTTAFFECLGGLLMCTVFVPKYGLEGIYISFFLAISAFCNAGFDVLGREGAYTSLCNYNGEPFVIYTIMALIVVGGLGFVVWHDIANFRRTRKLTLQTRVVLVMTAILIVSGACFFWIYEWNNTMAHLTFSEKIAAGFMQSITCRTCGFNSIDLAAMNPITKGLATALMFIGAAPGSTGGGVKVTTFAVVMMTVVSVLKNREDVVIWSRRVDKSDVDKALPIRVLGLTLVFGVSFAISVLQPAFSFLDITFEVTSAFATVGCTIGLSSVADNISKLLLISLMYLGRVGPVSFGISFAGGSGARKEIIPDGQIAVG